MEKVPKTYDPVSLTRILQGLERRIEALQSISIKQYKSVAADAAQNLKVNEVGYTLDDSQNFDLLVRASDSRLYRISAQASAVAATSSTPAGVYVLKSGDTMTGLLILSGDPATALGAATKQYADTKVADTGDTMTGALVIDGSADAIQLRVQGHSTQTSFLLVLEDSAGNDQVTVSNDGAVVINEEGNDADFRVESDGDANALYVDASANTVQVGAATTSDSAKFYVAGKISLSGELEANGDFNHDGSNVGFYDVTPVARPAAYTQTFSTATRTHSNPTASALTDSTGGTANTTLVDVTTLGVADPVKVNDNFADLVAQVNALIVDLANAKQVLNQVIDDHQANGLLQ